MTKRKILPGMLAGLLALGLVLAGCLHNVESIPDELVGSWGIGFMESLSINADGSGTFTALDCKWSVSGKTLTLKMDDREGTVTWSVNSGRLTLSNPDGRLKVQLTAMTLLGPLNKID